MVERLSSFQLPHPKDLEVVVVRLADGTIDVFKREDVEAMEAAEAERAS